MPLSKPCACFCILLILASLLSGCAKPEPAEPTDYFHDYGYDPAKLPDIITEPDLSVYEFGSPARITGFAGKDLTGKDLRELSPSFLAGLNYDQATIWPAATLLPVQFTPDEWLETAKDPGLGLRELHRQGIDGQGVAVAVFDKPILPEHREFAGRLTYHVVEPTSRKNQVRHFHGIAVASILGGGSTGVAPGASLHYFACPDDGKNFLHYTKALRQVLNLNRSLPPAERIRLVNISDGIDPKSKYLTEWSAALAEAAAAGVVVICSNTPELAPYLMGGCPPYLDRNAAANYCLAKVIAGERPQAIIVPSDCRTTAMNSGEDKYVYWGEGGFSWCIPYISGLVTLAWQINPELPYSQVMDLLETTAAEAAGARVVDPGAFIAAVQAK